MSSTVTEFPIPSLTVVPWPDVVIDTVGWDPRSAYVERFWLGVLGPSATWFVRRLADGLEAQPDGFELDLPTTAAELGLGARGGKHAPFMRTIERCCRFGATELSDGTLRARRKLPPLTRSQLERLPEPLRADHQRWIENGPAQPTGPVSAETVRQRARQLALSLLELGEDGATAERQLHRWRIHPAMAHDATAWAVARHEARLAAPPQVSGPEVGAAPPPPGPEAA
ncbi:MAG: hypothetical protein M3Z03_17080 [Actinomycetota bacterium]|nr:hypothetical protein [Actinomycetota bacterium]